MKLAEMAGKSVILVLAIATIAWFFGDLSNVPVSNLENLLKLQAKLMRSLRQKM